MRIMICGIYHLRYSPDMYITKETDNMKVLKAQTDEVVERLTNFHPKAIALEIDRIKQDETDELFESYKRGRAPEKDERDLLGFELALKLGHEKVHCIDDMYSREDNPGYSKVFENAQNEHPDVYEMIKTPPEDFPENTTVLEKLIWLTEKPVKRENHALLAKVGVNGDLSGVVWLEWWYRRNLVMAGRLATLADEYGDVLMIVGNSHVPILTDFLRDMKQYEIVEARRYLIDEH